MASTGKHSFPAIKLTTLLLLSTLPHVFLRARAQSDISCAQAPTVSARLVCEQLRKWDDSVRSAPTVSNKPVMPPAIPGLPTPQMAAELPPFATNPYQCMDLGCLCSYLGGSGRQGSNACTLANGGTLAKALRKEYRQLTDNERARYHAALRQLKDSGEYDRLAVIHSQFANAGSAHSGPGFLPWHREYVKRFEVAIRQIDPSLSLPYWDSVLESNLPNPRDSILWTDEFMGSSDGAGNVIGGAFAPWQTLRGRPNILRRLGAQGSLFTEAEIGFIMRQDRIENILAFTAPRQGCPIPVVWNGLEYTHGNVHIWVGGDMLDQSTSANDPLFFLHHSFVDLIWEMWRQQRQSRFDREAAYPDEAQQCASVAHSGAALMRPFEPWRNTDGLSNKYTDNLYEFAPRPTCTRENPGGCGSSYLFCDLSHGTPRCASKVRIGGACTGFQAGEDICHRGVCDQFGRCASSGEDTITTTTTTVVNTTPNPPPPTGNRRQQESCFNENECCAVWAATGECQKNPSYMTTWCRASCGRCQPRTYELDVECADRHFQCEQWAGLGECTNNPLWMAENCRNSCAKCTRSRAQRCGGTDGSRNRLGQFNRLVSFTSTTAFPTTTPAPVTITTTLARTTTRRPFSPGGGSEKCGSSGCYNENMCCQLWSLEGECTRNASWMSCNCRVSCGVCIPQDYAHGTCDDYHRECPQWASLGECSKNDWMLENCRLSCRSCFHLADLSGMCRRTGDDRSSIDSRFGFSGPSLPTGWTESDFDRRKRWQGMRLTNSMPIQRNMR